jgi:hypothetical protein
VHIHATSDTVLFLEGHQDGSLCECLRCDPGIFLYDCDDSRKRMNAEQAVLADKEGADFEVMKMP